MATFTPRAEGRQVQSFLYHANTRMFSFRDTISGLTFQFQHAKT